MADLFEYARRTFGRARNTGEQLADKGIAQATGTAERTRPGWSDDAFKLLRLYALTNAEFIGEDVKEFAYAHGLDVQADAAWGGVMRRGGRERVAQFVGYAKRSKNANRHGTPSRLWRSLIVGQSC